MTLVKLKTNNYKEVIKSKKLIDFINRIISTFPLTFVNLERIRKDIDSVDELFWIKDCDGKYLIVNDKFASSFHLNSAQIEGKSVDKFIPSYLVNFNKALNDYIKESRSVFVIEGFPLSGIPSGDKYQTIEIPVAAAEGNVIAIIGVSQKTEVNVKQLDLNSVLQPLKPFIKSYILIDGENKIKDVSQEFCNIFTLQSENLLGEKFYDVLPVLIKKIIEDLDKTNNINQTIKNHLWDKDYQFHLIKGTEGEKLLIVEAEQIAQPSSQDSETKSGFDFIIHNSPEPVFIYDKENLRFLQVNEAALWLYGYRKEEFLHLDLTDLYSPEDIQTLLEAPEEKFKDGLYSKPFRQKKKDGSDIFIEINRTSILYKEKEAYFNIIKNVTDKLNLDEESQLYKAIFNNSDNLLFITDKEGFIKSVNISVSVALGYSSKILSGSSFTSLVKDEERGKINSTIFQSGLKEKLEINTAIKKAGNELVNIKCTAQPIFNYKGEIESFIIICSEMSKEIITEIIREVPVVREQSVNKEIPEINFLSEIFHDLLTPINVILGFVQELSENIEQPTDEQKEAVEIINSNRGNLLNLINHIVEYIRIEKKQIELKYDSVKIIEIIETVKNYIDEETSGEVEISFGKISSSLEAKTDKQKFQRLLSLLVQIINKITGEKKIYISASLREENNFIISFNKSYNLSSEEFAEKLISLFSDEKNASSKYSGLSFLNLILCRSLLMLLKGRVKIVNEKGKSDIVFIFPLNIESQLNEVQLEKAKFESSESFPNEIEETKYSSEKDITLEEDKVETKKTISETKDEINLSQLSCLYIEDQLDSQILFSNQMKDLRQIYFAVSFEQALPLLQSNNFDFIVMDLNLQGDYNGLDILKIIKTMPDYENIPVIAVTAYLLPEDKNNFILAGFNDFISKPVFREKLINSLEKIFLVQE